jgi:hypothetical protein
MNVNWSFVFGLLATLAPLLEAYSDPSRYALTYCHLMRDTAEYKMYKFRTMCLHKVQIFGEEVKRINFLL